MRKSAEKEKGLAVAAMSSPNSPTPKKTVLYNHRKEWTNVNLLNFEELPPYLTCWHGIVR